MQTLTSIGIIFVHCHVKASIHAQTYDALLYIVPNYMLTNILEHMRTLCTYKTKMTANKCPSSNSSMTMCVHTCGYDVPCEWVCILSTNCAIFVGEFGSLFARAHNVLAICHPTIGDWTQSQRKWVRKYNRSNSLIVVVSE